MFNKIQTRIATIKENYNKKQEEVIYLNILKQDLKQTISDFMKETDPEIRFCIDYKMKAIAKEVARQQEKVKQMKVF